METTPSADRPTPRSGRRRLGAISTTLALLAAGAFIGVSSQHFASADVSSGSRPVLIPITPCRLSDTRPAPNTVGPRSSPLGAADTHTIDAQEAGTPCSGLIPADASALSLNITALGATDQSYLTVWAGGDRPLAASLNPAPGEPPVPNAVTTELSVDQEFEVYNNAGSVNVVIDANGYYVDHDHDDRYSPRSEADAKYADQSSTYTKSEVDAGFVPAPTEIGLSPAAFAPADNGWTLAEFWIARSFGVSGRKCAIADLDLPQGAVISHIDVNYANFSSTADLDVTVSERRPIDGRALGGDVLATATIPLPPDGTDLTTALTGIAVEGASPATATAAHSVKMCTTSQSLFINGMHLSL